MSQHPKAVVASYFPVEAILDVNEGVAVDGAETDQILIR